MAGFNDAYGSGDTGSGETGVNLGAHATGNPFPDSFTATANVTVAHTWLIPIVALVLLWLLGGVAFKGIRM